MIETENFNLIPFQIILDDMYKFLKTIHLNSDHFLAHKYLGNTYYHLKYIDNAYKYWKIAYLLNLDDEKLQNNIKVMRKKGYK